MTKVLEMPALASVVCGAEQKWIPAVGDRVIYLPPPDYCGRFDVPPKQRQARSGTIIATYDAGYRNGERMCRLELDEVWGDNVQEHSRRKKIVIGNIFESHLKPLA